jgi:hypothetical protein
MFYTIIFLYEAPLCVTFRTRLCLIIEIEKALIFPALLFQHFFLFAIFPTTLHMRNAPLHYTFWIPG